MWFKQSKLFQLTDSPRCSPIDLAKKLADLAFKPCRPSMYDSAGWVSPIDEEDMPLVEEINGYMMICLQVEDEITAALLPRAFSKFTRIYAYIDTKNNWLILGTNNEKKTGKFISMFKKSME